ncbi:MAG TPA: methyltransferase domain-containing protein [Acidimicrobiales bacterium]|nr:methyltransferase domain-containing protein [Acidimicrobiales bacterium]
MTAAADGWDPTQYNRFRDERRQPFADLLALVRPRSGGRVVDLGCGTGELTVGLHEHVGAGDTLGVDNSEAMLTKSAAYAGSGVHFETRDIATFDGPGYDVVFANASLHWVPDHERLLARLAGVLAPGGQLAFQVPANWDHPSHTTATEVAAERPFVEVLRGQPVDDHTHSVLAPEAYSTLLEQLGFSEQHVRLQVYGHRLASSEDVVEWVKGTLLTAYRRRLPTAAYDEFVDTYRRRLTARLGEARPYFYPFKRILCWGRRP